MRTRTMMLAALLTAPLGFVGCKKEPTKKPDSKPGAAPMGAMDVMDAMDAIDAMDPTDTMRPRVRPAERRRPARPAVAKGTLAPKTLTLRKSRIRVAVPSGWDERISTEFLGMAKYQEERTLYEWLESCEGSCLERNPKKNIAHSVKSRIDFWRGSKYATVVKSNKGLDAGRWELHLETTPSAEVKKFSSMHVPMVYYAVFHHQKRRDTIFRCAVTLTQKDAPKLLAPLQKACQKIVILGPVKPVKNAKKK